MNKHAQGSLLITTRAMLHASSLSYTAIAQATGLSASWLSRFASCALKEPSVSKVERLYTFLSGKKLGV